MAHIAHTRLLTTLLAIGAHAAVQVGRDGGEWWVLASPSGLQRTTSIGSIGHRPQGARGPLHSALHLYYNKQHSPLNGPPLANTPAKAPARQMFSLTRDPGSHGTGIDRLHQRQLHKQPLPQRLGWQGHKHHGHTHYGHQHHGHKHRNHKHHGHSHKHHGHGHKHHGHGDKHHGPGHGHHGYGHGHHIERRSVHLFWKKLGKGIKNWLHSHHFEPHHGVSDNTFTRWPAPETTTAHPSRTWPRWPAQETTTAHPSRTWPRWPAPETTTAHPSRTWPRWPAQETTTAHPSRTWPRWPAQETTTAHPSRTWPRWPAQETTTAHPSRTWPRWPAPKTTTPAASRAAGAGAPSSPPRPGTGVVVATAQPMEAGVWPACPPGFVYHTASGVCIERCPRGASYRQQACFCHHPGFSVDFVHWRCVRAGRTAE